MGQQPDSQEASQITVAERPWSVHGSCCAPAVGETIGRYQIVRRIGAGGMGTVYEAVHTLLRKCVALKLMREVAGGEHALARFFREAESAARVQHPHIVDVVDVGLEGVVPFMVMELLEGEDLEQRLVREPLAIAEAVDVILPIASALSELHLLGLIHRDIKPGNVFLAKDAMGHVVPKLLDFGVCRELCQEPARHDFAGTPHYMAPEQLRGELLDARTDQYALAVVLYQCLTGRTPFDGESLCELVLAIDRGEYTPADALCPTIPQELAEIITRAMAYRKEERFADLDQFARALLAFASPAVRLRYEANLSSTRVSSMPPPRWSDEELARCCTSLLEAGAPQVEPPSGQDEEPSTSMRWRAFLAPLAAAALIVLTFSLSRSHQARSLSTVAGPHAQWERRRAP